MTTRSLILRLDGATADVAYFDLAQFAVMLRQSVGEGGIGAFRDKPILSDSFVHALGAGAGVEGKADLLRFDGDPLGNISVPFADDLGAPGSQLVINDEVALYASDDTFFSGPAQTNALVGVSLPSRFDQDPDRAFTSGNPLDPDAGLFQVGDVLIAQLLDGRLYFSPGDLSSKTLGTGSIDPAFDLANMSPVLTGVQAPFDFGLNIGDQSTDYAVLVDPTGRFYLVTEAGVTAPDLHPDGARIDAGSTILKIPGYDIPDLFAVPVQSKDGTLDVVIYNAAGEIEGFVETAESAADVDFDLASGFFINDRFVYNATDRTGPDVVDTVRVDFDGATADGLREIVGEVTQFDENLFFFTGRDIFDNIGIWQSDGTVAGTLPYTLDGVSGFEDFIRVDAFVREGLIIDDAVFFVGQGQGESDKSIFVMDQSNIVRASQPIAGLEGILGAVIQNSLPTLPTLSATRVVENAPVGTLIGLVSFSDPDGDPAQIALADAGGGPVRLDGNRLVTTAPIDFETLPSFTVQIGVSDGFAALGLGSLFRIDVTDVDETPRPPAPETGPIEGDERDNVLRGTPQEDTIIGNGGDDSILGLDSADVIFGGNGADSIDAGGGNDTVEGGSGKDIISGRDGADFLQGGTGRDVLNGQTFADTLFGQNAADRIFGGVGGDTLNGGGGEDVLRGGDGRDRLVGGDDADVLHGDGGVDFSFGGDGGDILNGNAGEDRLNGQAGRDRLFGGGGNDTITGGGDDDFLQGGQGDDRLNGGDGDDTLRGDEGRDAFVFKNLNPADRDVVEDFEDGSDVLLFKGGNPNFSAADGGVLVAMPNGYQVLVQGWTLEDVDRSDWDII